MYVCPAGGCADALPMTCHPSSAVGLYCTILESSLKYSAFYRLRLLFTIASFGPCHGFKRCLSSSSLYSTKSDVRQACLSD